MTDDQIHALLARLDVTERRNQAQTQIGAHLREALQDLLTARSSYRVCRGSHEDSCNTYMGWDMDSPCDCIHKHLARALGAENLDHEEAKALCEEVHGRSREEVEEMLGLPIEDVITPAKLRIYAYETIEIHFDADDFVHGAFSMKLDQDRL